MNSKIIKFFLIIFIIAGTCFAQQKQGNAGAESLFLRIGSGAKQLSMGNAAAAYPNDAYAFAWNPAGMNVVQQKQLGFSLFTLFEGVQYHQIGYIHPTLNIGTFGFGIARFGVDDINFYDDVNNIPVDRGTFNFWKAKLTLSYALTLFKGFSVGINGNAYRDELGEYSANGFGLDAGIHYGITSRNILNDLHFGCTMYNLLQPSLKMDTEQDILPYKIKAGMAKIFTFSNKYYLLLMADIDHSEFKENEYHFGMEVGLGNMVFIRGGYEKEQLTAGVGLLFKNLQIDYGIKSIGDAKYFPVSNLFSLKLYFGKTIEEQKELLEEKRRLEIQRRFNERVQAERLREINESLQNGRSYLEKGDFYNARVEFSKILKIDEDNKKAQELLQEAIERQRLAEEREQNQLLEKERVKVSNRKDSTFVHKKLTEGIEALENRNYREAIEKWEEGLERDPQNTKLKKYIKNAEDNLVNQINISLTRAQKLINQGEVSRAYDILNQAKQQSRDNERIYRRVVNQINSLNKSIDFATNFQKGKEYFDEENYTSAVQYFRKALDIQPDHGEAKNYYRTALAHAKGATQEMTEEVRTMFNQGIILYRQGHYKKALERWEEALQLDPYNIKLLKAIEGAKNKIKSFRKNK